MKTLQKISALLSLSVFLLSNASAQGTTTGIRSVPNQQTLQSVALVQNMQYGNLELVQNLVSETQYTQHIPGSADGRADLLGAFNFLKDKGVQILTTQAFQDGPYAVVHVQGKMFGQDFRANAPRNVS